jgi:opacity protein-like surface antigen
MRFDFSVRLCLLTLAVGAAALTRSRDATAQAAYSPPPASPAADAPPAPPIIRPYAWIKPTVILSAKPIESFSQPNASAGTAAANPVLSARAPGDAPLEDASLTFQAAQSRLGFWFNEKAPIRGQFELDFIDFTKSSPTVGALPRLRIAKVEWAFNDSTVLMAGQDWDLFAPVNPFTLDIVAVAFQAGNTGFMRQQAKLIWHNQSLEVGGAIGLAGINNAFRAVLPEYNPLPTIAARAAVLFGAAGRIGVSAIATNWRFAAGAAAERTALAGAADIYGDLTPFERFNLRFEAYFGQNLGNLGSLSLGTGNAVDNIKEVGGFLSAKYGFTDSHALYALAGMAKVLNDEDVVPSYTYGTVAMGTIPAESTATVAGTGAGMTSNFTARLGYEYRYDKTIAFMAEGFAFQSKHVLNTDFDADIDGDRTAFGGELGLFFTL